MKMDICSHIGFSVNDVNSLHGFRTDTLGSNYGPECLKPVSAMKGSREKRGLSPPAQLTVNWAPDVYDPVPMSSLHIVINRPHKHGKKKCKSKQKNTSKSRGSKSKDKQQAGKDMGFKLCEHDEEVTCVSEIQQPGDIDFLPGFAENFSEASHGSSLHLSSVTEAT